MHGFLFASQLAFCALGFPSITTGAESRQLLGIVNITLSFTTENVTITAQEFYLLQAVDVVAITYFIARDLRNNDSKTIIVIIKIV